MTTIIGGEEVTLPKMLHEYTYPELLETKDTVIDWSGIMWTGKDRKGLNAPNPNDLFKAWQKDVQRAIGRAGFLEQRVMDYFQATKYFSKPPRTQEAEELMKEMVAQYPVLKDEAAKVVEAVKAMAPRFTWSPSKIMQFDTCPYQFAAQYYYKTLPYQETDATRWGTAVHEEAERFMKGQEVKDPEAFKMVEKWVKALAKVDGERFVEHKLGVDGKLKPADYDEAEGRMILDFGIKRGNELMLYDYKTGKVKDSDTQLKIYALVMGIQHPEVQKISYKYIWLKAGVTTGGLLDRKDLLPLYKEVKAKIDKMKDCWENENFPKRKNGLCRNWCGVTECPHCGR